MKNDSVVYQKSFGFVDEEQDEHLTSFHHFALGSIQKEFPGVAIMQLQEKGAVNLEDKLSLYLPHLPSWANKIKVRNLLHYSSGLPHVDWDSHFKEGVASQKKVLGNLSSLNQLEFEPGTDYLYSNYNPMLLQEIEEAVTGMTFSEYIESKGLFLMNWRAWWSKRNIHMKIRL